MKLLLSPFLYTSCANSHFLEPPGFGFYSSGPSYTPDDLFEIRRFFSRFSPGSPAEENVPIWGSAFLERGRGLLYRKIPLGQDPLTGRNGNYLVEGYQFPLPKEGSWDPLQLAKALPWHEDLSSLNLLGPEKAPLLEEWAYELPLDEETKPFSLISSADPARISLLFRLAYSAIEKGKKLLALEGEADFEKDLALLDALFPSALFSRLSYLSRSENPLEESALLIRLGEKANPLSFLGNDALFLYDPQGSNSSRPTPQSESAYALFLADGRYSLTRRKALEEMGAEADFLSENGLSALRLRLPLLLGEVSLSEFPGAIERIPWGERKPFLLSFYAKKLASEEAQALLARTEASSYGLLQEEIDGYWDEKGPSYPKELLSFYERVGHPEAGKKRFFALLENEGDPEAYSALISFFLASRLPLSPEEADAFSEAYFRHLSWGDPTQERAALNAILPLFKGRSDYLEARFGKALEKSDWSEESKGGFARRKYQTLYFGSLSASAPLWPASLSFEEQKGLVAYALHSGNPTPFLQTFFASAEPEKITLILPLFLEGIPAHRFSLGEMKALLLTLKKRGLLSEEAAFAFFSSPELLLAEGEELRGLSELFPIAPKGDYPGLGLAHFVFALLDEQPLAGIRSGDYLKDLQGFEEPLMEHYEGLLAQELVRRRFRDKAERLTLALNHLSPEFLDEVLAAIRSYAPGDPQYLEILSPIVFSGSYSSDTERRYVSNVVYALGYKPRNIEEFKERYHSRLVHLGLL